MATDEEQVLKGLHDLEKVRAAVASAQEDKTDDFVVAVLGGKRVLEKTGKAYDYIQGKAANVIAGDFAKTRTGQETMRWSVSAYGDEACGIMARSWCRKMQHYYDLEVTGEVKPGQAFSPAHHASFVDSIEFSGLALTVSANGPKALQKRIDQLEFLF